MTGSATAGVFRGEMFRPTRRIPPGAHLGDGDVIAAAAGAQLSSAGVNRAIGRSKATRARRSSGLDTLQSSLELSDLKP